MSIKESLNWAHPIIRTWFSTRLGTPTEPQTLAWPSILKGQHTLIAAPTGSGKTLSAFLVCINKLVKKALKGSLEQKTEILYISPLKALSNDIQKNLTEPLLEIEELALSQGLTFQKIDVQVRTGDTPNKERQKMLKSPPHILVTTPESFYILLTSEKSRERLKDIKTVIVDEIHALMNNKRGAHLSLSLDRLEALTTQKPMRIGLSATQKPLDMVARFLTGNQPKPAKIINTGHVRPLELSVEVPGSPLGPVASNEMWDELYDKMACFSKEYRSTLIFVNTRRLAERVAHHLSERLGEDKVGVHHGSLSKKLRQAAEARLKEGKLTVLVATASLELGIDIGTVDLVCILGSPRSINVALQRVGRAGHCHGGISKGIFFPSTRDELFECAALIYAIRQGEMDEIIYNKEPLDILAQQIVAACATQDWHENELYELLTRAFHYINLTKETFNAILEMLSDGIAGSRGRYGTYLFRDKIHGMIKARRGARLTAITNGGAIPETGLFMVVSEPEGLMVGTLDEDFAIESNRGDIILLGTTSWRIKRIESNAGRVLVENAYGASPSVPFWQGEAPGRTKELSYFLSDLRQKLDNFLPKTEPLNIKIESQPQAKMTVDWLKEHCCLDKSGAEQLIEYLLEGRAVLSSVPSHDTLIAERFFDEAGGMQLVIHSPFGMRINKAWGLALRKKFCRTFNFELQAAATDNGLNISLTEQHSFPLEDVFYFLHPNTIQEVIIQAVLQSPLFTTRWRFTATRSLALLRFRNGKKCPPNIQRILSDDLLAAVFPDAAACQDNLGGREIELPDHPLIQETMKDILNDALDIQGLTHLLQAIRNKTITCLAIDTPVPSVFSNEILNANPYAFIDDAPLEERRARAVEMRRILPDTFLNDMGKLDAMAIQEVQQQVWPDLRNADELHDFLQTVIALPENFNLTETRCIKQDWHLFFDELLISTRAEKILVQNRLFWVASEKKQDFNAIYFDTMDGSNKENALTSMIRGWVQHLGPTSSLELSNLLSLDQGSISTTLLKLENTGLILRGNFTQNSTVVQELEWCERRLLARIHKLTLGKLRASIKPVTAAQFVNWLLKWQHLKPETQLNGEQGLMEIIRKLQGFEIPANAWEKNIFSKRMKNYHRDLLDRLCLNGSIGWGRFSAPNKKTNLSSNVPIGFFLSSESEHFCSSLSLENQSSEIETLSPIAKKIYDYLTEKGASFLYQIARGINHLESELEKALWELVAVGAITADSFDNLRALIDPRRRLNKMRSHPFISSRGGRWSLLKREQENKTTENLCWILLKRYGIVFRDLLAREKNLPPWRDLLMTFRRLENQGKIRGGRFVDGFLGDQFALDYVIDSLRASIKQEPVEEKIITLSAADPLNLIGIILPGSRVSSLSKTKIALKNGAPIQNESLKEN